MSGVRSGLSLWFAFRWHLSMRLRGMRTSSLSKRLFQLLALCFFFHSYWSFCYWLANLSHPAQIRVLWRTNGHLVSSVGGPSFQVDLFSFEQPTLLLWLRLNIVFRVCIFSLDSFHTQKVKWSFFFFSLFCVLTFFIFMSTLVHVFILKFTLVFFFTLLMFIFKRVKKKKTHF